MKLETIRIELDLVRTDHLDLPPTRPAPVSVPTAHLHGQLAGARGEPLAGEVHLVAGSNRGRHTGTNQAGRFSLLDLHPGLSVIEVRSSGSVLARREVRFVSAQQTHFHVSLARPARVGGRVVDTDGEPVEQALIFVDGQMARTDSVGEFQVTAVAGGRVLVEIQAGGFASQRRELDVKPASTVTSDDLEIELAPEARLRLTVTNAASTESPTRVWILPSIPEVIRTSPWNHFEALEVVGDVLEVAGLPASRVWIHVHREGVHLRGGAVAAWLHTGRTCAIALNLVPAPMLRGNVFRGGVAVAGAIVELHATDPQLAVRTYLGLAADFADREFLPLFEPVISRTQSDESGAYMLNDASWLSQWRRFVVVGPEGEIRLERAIGPFDHQVDVDLLRTPRKAARLSLATAVDTDPLPYELWMQGEPREAGVLHGGAPLWIDGLREGTWSFRMTQGARVLIPEQLLELHGEVRLPVLVPAPPLPNGDPGTQPARRRWATGLDDDTIALPPP